MVAKLDPRVFALRMRNVHGNRIIFHGEYAGDRNRIPVECRACGHTWDGRPSDLSAGHGCAACNGALKKTHGSFATELFQRFGDRVRLLHPYLGANDKHLFRCQCGSEFLKVPSDILRARYPCAKCYFRSKIITDYTDWPGFRMAACRLSNRNYLRFARFINPRGLYIGRRRKPGDVEYDLDHIYSVSDAFTNYQNLERPITLIEVCHPCNLQVLSRTENCRKGPRSAITADELRRRIHSFNRRLKFRRAQR